MPSVRRPAIGDMQKSVYDPNEDGKIAYSELALSGALKKGDIEAAAGIEYSKLALTGAVLAADIKAAADIPLSKLVSTVCSETEADNKISDHAGIADAHHTQVLNTKGTYTGDDAVNRAIPHGLGVVPKIVFIIEVAIGGIAFRIFEEQAKIFSWSLATQGEMAVTVPNTTNFYVGNATSPSKSANENAILYAWAAMG